MDKNLKLILHSVSRFFLIWIIFSSCQSRAASNTWFYPWNNKISSLQSADDTEVIPSFVGSKELRILKISKFQGKKIKNIQINSKLSDVEVLQLPVIKNFNNDNILDLVFPIIIDQPMYDDNNSDKYFLVKIKAKSSGTETISINITTDTKSYVFSKNIKVGNFSNDNPIDLNVFAYFDYNFIVKDLKHDVINDLVSHNVSTIVIPPSAIPEFGNPNANTNNLKSYINGTDSKFKYYVLYLNLTNSTSPFINTSSQNLLQWYNNIENEFTKLNIKPNQLLIFPYDESKDADIQKILKIKGNFRKLGINNPFYATIDNVDSFKALSNNVEYLQVIPEILEKVSTTNTSSKLWTYQLTYGSRNRSPQEYRAMAMRAFKNNATGIGVWSYADIAVAADDNTRKEFLRGTPTWKVDYKAWSAEYSLIYRQKDQLYSSLRWEALSYGINEYFWFQKLKTKYGDNKIQTLVQNIINNKDSQSEIDQLKLNLIN